MKKVPKTVFQQAIESTPEIANCYQLGISALGQYSNKIVPADTRQCEGSVDIDACTKAKYPRASRWDYAIGYANKVYFVEVHGATTSEVSAVEKKLIWLKDWLRAEAPELYALRANEKPYYWIQSGKFDILRTSPQYKRVAQLGLLPVPKLSLPPT